MLGYYPSTLTKNMRNTNHCKDYGTVIISTSEVPGSQTSSEDEEDRALLHNNLRSQLIANSSQTASISRIRQYGLPAIFLFLVLAGDLTQTETAAYVQGSLGYKQPFFMLYLTQIAWILPYSVYLLVVRIQQYRSWSTPSMRAFWHQQLAQVRDLANGLTQSRHDQLTPVSLSPIWYLIKVMTLLTILSTLGTAPWWFAIPLTTPSDLTAIFNSGAVFAYLFSVPLLREKWRLDLSLSVLISVCGVLVIAYGNTPSLGTTKAHVSSHHGLHPPQHPKPNPDYDPSTRLLGNILVGTSAFIDALASVLYKKYACSDESSSDQSSSAQITLATFTAFLQGCVSLIVLPLPLLAFHVTGTEIFTLPSLHQSIFVALCVLAGATASAAGLVLISLTSPVFATVSAVLSIVVVDAFEGFVMGREVGWATVAGGVCIVAALGVMALGMCGLDENGELREGRDRVERGLRREALMGLGLVGGYTRRASDDVEERREGLRRVLLGRDYVKGYATL